MDVQLKLPISLPIGCNEFDWFVTNSSYWRTAGWLAPSLCAPDTQHQVRRPLGPDISMALQLRCRNGTVVHLCDDGKVEITITGEVRDEGALTKRKCFTKSETSSKKHYFFKTANLMFKKEII